MNVLDAAYHLVHDQPGGAEALGPRLGMSGKLLSNKVRQADATHVLTLSEALRMQQLTGDHRIFLAEAEQLGYIPIPAPNTAAGDNITKDILDAAADFGDYMREVNKALADNIITTNERKELERRLATFMAAAYHLQADLASKAANDAAR